MSDTHLPYGPEVFRKAVRKLAEEPPKPLTDRIDKEARFHVEVFGKMAAMGLFDVYREIARQRFLNARTSSRSTR